ncbi:MAG: hypothetical protein MO846_00910 [Candidatus Devosia symbiotica]|nr:hypothetical protein [Candidatus Devosia symbiotica]
MTSIILAALSKGRLKELTRDWFAAKGVTIARPGGACSYLGAIDGMPKVTVRFFPASKAADSRHN